jgi:hypothetical protein
MHEQRPTVDMGFEDALWHLKRGGQVTRDGWNGQGMWIAFHIPEDWDATRPYIEMSPVDGKLVPWVASQTDLLADDWRLL